MRSADSAGANSLPPVPGQCARSACVRPGLASPGSYYFDRQCPAYSSEAATARHALEWQAWTSAALPEEKVLIAGAVTHSTNVVEHPELVTTMPSPLHRRGGS